MLNKIFNNLSPIFYLQIWENRIKVTEITSNKIFDESPLIAIKKNDKGEETVTAVGNNVKLMQNELDIEVINPFSHPRTLISNFMAAEKVLQYIIKTLSKHKLLAAPPLTVIHPMEKLDGGMTQIEFRAFKELALGAGSREAVVYDGPELNVYDFNFIDIKKKEKVP
ncbi:MAG: rod shape-determining protein [Bacteroidota bacterium]